MAIMPATVPVITVVLAIVPLRIRALIAPGMATVVLNAIGSAVHVAALDRRRSGLIGCRSLVLLGLLALMIRPRLGGHR